MHSPGVSTERIYGRGRRVTRCQTLVAYVRGAAALNGA